MTKDNGFGIRRGRTNNKSFLITEFNIIDRINEYAGCETLGFYLSIKRYINRKDFEKENEVNYTQAWLSNKFNITNYKYYKHLHSIFNVGLIDIEKFIIVDFFINYNNEGKKNPLVRKKILYFSTLENKNINLKGNIENIIADKNPEIPLELINIVSVDHKTNYIIHDYPPIDIYEKNNYKLIPYREWDKEMSKFQRGENRSEKQLQNNKNSDNKNKKIPSSDNQKNPPSDNQKYPSSDNQKVNIIIETSNSIIESSNNTINQSIENENKKEIDRLIDIDNKFKNIGYKTYKELLSELQLKLTLSEYPYTNWLSTVEKSIWEMYYYNETKVKNRMVDQYEVVTKLQDLNWNMVVNAIDKVNEVSQYEEIKYPIAFMKTTLFNEIDEYSARVQAQVNYDLNELNENKTKKYGKNEVEKIVSNKRKEYYDKNKNEKDNSAGIYSKRNINDSMSPNNTELELTEKYKDTRYEGVFSNIKAEITPAAYNSFFSETILDIKETEGTAILKIKGDNLIKQVLENKFINLIEKHFSSIGIEKVLIENA